MTTSAGSTARRRSASWPAASTAARLRGERRLPAMLRERTRRATASSRRSARSTGRNRIVAAFYDGPGWIRFRKWERLFLGSRGERGGRGCDPPARPGDRTARRAGPRGRHRRRREPGVPAPSLDGLRRRHRPDPARGLRPPVPVDVGPPGLGRGRAAPLRRCDVRRLLLDRRVHLLTTTTPRPCDEMRRVTRPGGPVVVADETPGMHRAGLGHLIGAPGDRRLWLRQLGLDPGSSTWC